MRTLFPVLIVAGVAVSMLVVAYVGRIIYDAEQDFKHQFAAGPDQDWRRGLSRVIYNWAWGQALGRARRNRHRQRVAAARAYEKKRDEF